MFKFRFLNLLMVSLMLCTSVSLSSCSKDDDEPGSGSGSASITIDGTTIKFGNVGYYYDAEDGDHGIMFSDFNPESNKVPNKINMLIINVYGEGKAIPTGSFNDYDVTLMINYNPYDENGTYLEGYGSNELKVSEDGGKYTVSISNLKLEGWTGDDDEEDVRYTTSFSYTGGIPYYSKFNVE